MKSVTAATVTTVSCLAYTLAMVVGIHSAPRVAMAIAMSTTATTRTAYVKTSSITLCLPGSCYSECVLSWQVS
eukprot:12402-Heterococcus_DN1.PRE.1